jgi:hypothetical protein
MKSDIIIISFVLLFGNGRNGERKSKKNSHLDSSDFSFYM